MQKLTRSLFAVGAVLGLAACGDDVSVTPPTPPPAPTVTGVTVSPSQTTIRVGERVILSANVSVNGSGVSTAVTWSSANAAIASVSATGEVTGVAAGQTTIRAASTANTGVSGSAAVTVTADRGVQSVTIAPTSAILSPGESIQAVANVAAASGVARTVTWASSATAVATVDATGKITAVAPGTATITATSTADNTVSGALALTVRVPTAASVSIKSITQQVNGLLVPVDQNNVFGQVDVTLNVDPGDRQLAKVAVYVDGVEAASQTFGTSNMIASSTGALVAPSEIVLSVNTAEFNSTTGATKYKNGPRSFKAEISTIASGSSAAAPAANVTQTLVLRNISGFIGAVSTDGNSATDLAGYTWRSGALTVTALPVLYGDVVAPFNVPTIQSATITFGSNTCNTELIGRQRSATLSGSTWTTTFPNTASAVTGGGDVDNVFRYEYNPGLGGCAGNLTRGEVPTIAAVVSDGSTLSTAAGGFLNSPYLAFAGNGVAPDARFAVRLDNRRPDRVASPFDAVWQNTNTTSPIIRTGNWVNDALNFQTTSANTSNRLQLLTRATDGGVSRLADSEITYETRVGVDATAADASAAVTSVAGLAESSANNSYTMRSLIKDKLGNTNNPSSTIGSGTRTFGVDRTAPVLAIDTISTTLDTDSTINVAPLSAIAVPFVATDTASGGATPSGFFNLAGTPLTTEVRRVEVSTGSALTRYWCPATAAWTSTATGCTSWVSGQSYLAPLTTVFTPFGTNEGYYRVTSVVTDQAGNQSTTSQQNLLYDITAPAVGGISYPAFLNGGSTVSFTTQANDNVDLGTGTMWLTYTAFADNFQWPNILLGSFGSDAFTTSAPLQLQTTFIRSIQIAAGGAAPGAALLPPTGVTAQVTDVAGNSSGASNQAIPVGSIQLTNPSTAWNTIPFTWAQTAPAAAVNVDREAGGSNSQTVTITARATGPTGTFANPFTSRVDFWVQDAAGATWRYIGSSTSPSVTDNGVNRVWSFSIVWNPEGAYTAPFPTGTTNVRVIAVGVNSVGDALSTDPAAAAATNISVVVP